MGETKVKIKVAPLVNPRWKEIEVLVDTGANYTTIPAEILEELGIKRESKIMLEYGDGRNDWRDTGYAFIEVEGKIAPNVILFAEKKDALVLGLITLESCGLGVDPLNKKLFSLSAVHHYSQRKGIVI